MNTVTIEVVGLNLNKLINEAVKQNIRILKSYQKDKKLTVTIPNKHQKLFIKILKNSNYEFSVKDTKGIINKLLGLTKRYGLIAGIIAVIAVSVFAGQFVLDVEVNSNSELYSAEIKQSLDENGISGGILKSAVDTLAVEKLIYNNFSDASYVHAAVRGSVLLVTVRKALPPPDIEDMTVKSPIVSRYDAIITRIVKIDGTSLVKAGDAVKRGDVLIGAYIIVGEEQVGVRAMGEVYGTVYYNERIVVGDTKIVMKRTGNKEIVKQLIMWGEPEPVYPAFKTYEAERSVSYISDIIPLKLITTTFYETVAKEEPYDYMAEEELLYHKALARLRLLFPQGSIPKNHWKISKKVDKKYVIDVYYEVEQKISEVT